MIHLIHRKIFQCLRPVFIVQAELSSIKKLCYSFTVASGILFAPNLQAIDLSLSNLPLASSTAVEPNVMFLIDSSGSMDNIVWHIKTPTEEAASGIPGFNTTIDYATGTYTDWSVGRWGATNNNIRMDSIGDGACGGSVGEPSNFLPDITVTDPDGSTRVLPRYVIMGWNGTTRSCLILPDPLDSGRTWITGNYLNYLFNHYPSGTDLSTIIPSKTRLQTVQNVTDHLVDTTLGMRFGASRFDSGDGARVLSPCDSDDTLRTHSTAVRGAINGISTSGATPLAESLYALTFYFRGLRNPYTTRILPSPVEHRCQKNFVVALTDGLPNGDNTIRSGSDPDIAATAASIGCDTCTLPNWDQYDTVTTTPIVVGPYPHFYDGHGTGGEASDLLLDDIAKYAYDLDLRKAPDLDKADIGFDQPPFAKQNIETYTVGFSIANQMLEDAAHYGSGLLRADPASATVYETNPDKTHYFVANNEAQLTSQLQQAITNIRGESGSAAAVAASSTGFTGDTGALLFQGIYDPKTWSGDLRLFELTYNESDKKFEINPVSSGATPVTAAAALTEQLTTGGGVAARKVLTFDPVDKVGRNFTWDGSGLTVAQKAQMDNVEQLLHYIRGEQSCEESRIATYGDPSTELSACQTGTAPSITTHTFRNRNIDGSGFYGSLINSSPIFIANPRAHYPDKWLKISSTVEAPESAKPYSEFKEKYLDRPATLYVGMNDGMLHALDAQSAVGGLPPTLKEKFAFVPAKVIPDLDLYASVGFAHRYYVDGTPTVIDAFFDSDWHTVLAGGLNNGGQGVYTLDVTTPDTFSASNVMWEFTDSDDVDLGYTHSRPAIIRMHNAKWVVAFGNGYNNTEADGNVSTTGNAVLYIVDIVDGSIIKKIDTGVGTAQDPHKINRSNGLTTIAPVDLNGDYIVDYIYAGDIFGNMWRFDVSSNDPADWGVFGRGTLASPIFVAKTVDSGGADYYQPITSRPDIIRTSTRQIMLLFGTGMYLQQIDKTDTSPQTFYGLLDDPIGDKLAATLPPQITRAPTEMVKQYVISPTTKIIHSSGNIVRNFSREAAGDYYQSWYIDLPEAGERVVGTPTARGSIRKRIIFSSIVPTEDACSFGGHSWLIELDARNGNATSTPVYDLNSDGKLDSDDNTGGKINNGWYQEGIQTRPTIISGPSTEVKVLSSSTGLLSAIGEEKPTEGRVSWRQIK